MIQAVIFDLDGTLLNSLADLGNSVNRVLTHFNKEIYPLSTYNTFVGNGVYKLVQRAFGEDFEALDTAFELFLKDYEANCDVDSKLYEGVHELLKSLNDKNIPIAISTNKAQNLTDKLVKHYMGDIEFVDVIGDRFDDLKKPNPHYPLQIMDKMNLKPENILFVGDSDVDMMTAKSAGFKAVGVSWGFRSTEELERSGANEIITNASEVLKFFENV